MAASSFHARTAMEMCGVTACSVFFMALRPTIRRSAYLRSVANRKWVKTSDWGGKGPHVFPGTGAVNSAPIDKMSDPLASIIMRSFNEGWALRETLPALQAQEYRNWELLVIDSGSTDGSVELIRKAAPRHFVQIAPHEYQPARVMNQGMELARSEYGIFLNADATPQGPDW